MRIKQELRSVSGRREQKCNQVLLQETGSLTSKSCFTLDIPLLISAIHCNALLSAAKTKRVTDVRESLFPCLIDL